MPITKNILTRLLIMDECLSNQTVKWSWGAMMNKVNEALKLKGDTPVGRTTFYKDLALIEGGIYSGEIERIKDGKRVYLRYKDPKFSIKNEPITPLEATQIKSALTILSRFKGAPQFEWLNETIPAIESKLGFIDSDRKIIEFQSNIYYKGLQFIPILFNLILNRRALRLKYRGFKHQNSQEFEVHPQYLKQYNHRWYLFGIREEYYQRIQIYPLDRISKIIEVSTSYIELKQHDWENYFSDMIGVSRKSESNDPKVVKLLILDKEQAAYIQTKPIHESQKPLKKTALGYETSIEVLLNYELNKTILSFGEKIKVLEPESLKISLRDSINKMISNYRK